MSEEKWILGVDAGNTKTLAFVAKQDGSIAGLGRSGCGDIYGAASPEAAIAAVGRAIETALSEANADKSGLSACAFSMAGADWPEDYDFIRGHMEKQGFGRNIVIVNDAIGGLRAGSCTGFGVSVVLGTGAAIGARSNNGSVWHGSFWIRRLGSDVFINNAYTAIMDAELGFRKPTALTGEFLHIYGSGSAEELLHDLTRREGKKSVENRLLIGAILDTAMAGDEAASAIVDDFSNRAGNYAIAAAKKVGFTDGGFDLIFSGGMCRHDSHLLEKKITDYVRGRFPNVTVLTSSFEPVVGALFLGFEAAGITITEKLKRTLLESMPDFSFFQS